MLKEKAYFGLRVLSSIGDSLKGGIGKIGKIKNNANFEHFSDFALYGRWEGLNRPERLDLSSLRDPRIEFSILRTFIFLFFGSPKPQIPKIPESSGSSRKLEVYLRLLPAGVSRGEGVRGRGGMGP